MFNFFKSKPEPKKVKAVAPAEPVLYQFRALKTFRSEDTLSDYCKGMVYSVRRGNDKLASLVDLWADEGKVEKL